MRRLSKFATSKTAWSWIRGENTTSKDIWVSERWANWFRLKEQTRSSGTRYEGSREGEEKKHGDNLELRRFKERAETRSKQFKIRKEEMDEWAIKDQINWVLSPSKTQESRYGEITVAETSRMLEIANDWDSYSFQCKLISIFKRVSAISKPVSAHGGHEWRNRWRLHKNLEITDSSAYSLFQ